jgi:hypothetical protein
MQFIQHTFLKKLPLNAHYLPTCRSRNLHTKYVKKWNRIQNRIN